MKVKRYVGETMQDTIFKVKSDLGDDALILNTRKIKKGGVFGFLGKMKFEVLAALEEPKKDEQRTLQEISELKTMVKEMNKKWHMEKNEQYLPDELVNIYSYLKKQDIEDDFINEIINQLKENKEKKILPFLKESIIKVLGSSAPIEIRKKPHIVALVGATGVGKTTTIAKLAASFLLGQGKKVGLVTTDTYRIAAIQQLKTYSDIMNIPLEVIYNEAELPEIIKKKYQGYDLVLVDTAGTSVNNRLHMGRLKGLVNHEIIDEIHLIISLNTKSIDIKGIIDNFSLLNPDKLLLTKLDETMTFGDLINIRYQYDLPFSYITFGQEVPDDIREADPDYLYDYIMRDFK